MRILATHVERLSGAFAGPRRADRMAGLWRIKWDDSLGVTHAWHVRDRAGRAEEARLELLDRLMAAIGL
jgi:hypothetical protein